MTEVPPILLSAIICEKVIFDRITGMPSIINIIQNINAPTYPVRYPSLVFFCELTNGHGKTKTTIRLVEEQGTEDRKIRSYSSKREKESSRMLSRWLV